MRHNLSDGTSPLLNEMHDSLYDIYIRLMVEKNLAMLPLLAVDSTALSVGAAARLETGHGAI